VPKELLQNNPEMPSTDVRERRLPTHVLKPIAQPAMLALIALPAAAGALFILWRIFASGATAQQLALGVTAPSVILAIVLLVILRQERKWSRALREIKSLAHQCRAGEAPIEELSNIGGNFAPLVETIQDLLRDLREADRKVAQLDAEMHQKVVQRTDALQRAIGSLKKQATHDPLTALHNRRMLDEALPRAIEHARSRGEELAIVIIDIDHFKHLNDSLGHAAGDTLLRDAGNLIRSTVVELGSAYRMGGDEFVLLLPGVDEAQARGVTDRLGKLFDAMMAPLKVEPRPRLSMGMSLLGEAPEPNASALLRCADEELYRHKRRGRATGSHDRRVPPNTAA
jgi:diguanylate cyclase (GGDEF)-like protein